MKRIVLIVWLLFFGIAAGAQTQRGAQYIGEEKKQVQRVQQSTINCGYRRPIRVASFVTNPPFGWVDVLDEGTRRTYLNDGLSFFVFSKIARDLKFLVSNIGYESYYDAIAALKRGNVDVVAGVYFDKRFLGVGASLLYPGYFKNQARVYFRKGKERPVRSFDDLRDLRGVVRQEELIYSLIYQSIPKEIQIREVSGARAAYTMLLNGEADFLISSIYAAEAEMRRFKLHDDIVRSDFIVIEPEMFFLFSTNSECMMLRPQFEAYLKEKKLNRNALDADMRLYIEKWGSRFGEAVSLTEELKSGASGAAENPM
ncbi:MAG: transporter substrate-binding domain-containing protein [Alphaproteobacteria bacterium]|nr:transporter substrate-binding domain-containing protein [Alphaproteobacteria bacterium]